MYTNVPAHARQHHPARVLMEATDPVRRAEAHLELGLRAMAREDDDTAELHLRSAAQYDPTDERPRVELERLEKRAASNLPPKGMLRWLFGRA